MYRKTSPEWIKHADFELWDLAALELAFILSIWIRMDTVFAIGSRHHLQYAVSLVVAHFINSLVFHNYKSILQRGYWIEFVCVVRQVLMDQIIAIVLVYILHESGSFSRLIFVLSTLFGIAFCYIIHLIWKKVVRERVLHKKDKNQMMIITGRDHLEELVAELTDKTYRGYKITSAALLDGSGPEPGRKYRVPMFFCIGEVLNYIAHNVVDEVYIDMGAIGKNGADLAEQILDTGTVVHVGVGSLSNGMPNAQVTKYHNLLAVTGTIAFAHGGELFLKRAADIIGGIVGLAITGVLCIFVVPAIKHADPGPAFFKQERVGKGGRIFKIIKFRSMYVDAEERKKELMEQNEMNGLMFKMENDPRVIGSEQGPGKGFGNFIRRTSIDEFPQFLNVLKGEMSLVGTRPPTVEEFKQYKPYHKARLAMRPGLTGLWQVSGRSNVTDFDEIVRLDTEYIKNWNPGQDLKILFKTFKVVCTQKGSK